MSAQRARLAVVTGGHPFDVPGFHDLLQTVCGEGFTPYVQHLEEFATSPPAILRSYAAVLFYFFPLIGPVAEGGQWFAGQPAAAIESLLDAGQGLIVLHHAVLAYPAWPVWDDVVGATGRDRFTFHGQRRLSVTITEPTHEITAGLRGWEMTDETYCMPAPTGTPLLRVAHPESMPTIGWVRTCRASRVVCLQSGHDAESWSNPGFQAVLRRSIAYAAARRLAGEQAAARPL